MNKSEITKLLCSNLCVGNYSPFSTNDFIKLLDILEIKNIELDTLGNISKSELNLLFEDAVSQDYIERIWGLIQRQASIIFDYIDLEKWGVKIVTIFDNEYPKQIKEKLQKKAPVLLYYCGNLSILDNKFIGFVGSRDSNNDDIIYVHNWIDEIKNLGFGVVSGGAKGIDSIASTYAIHNNMFAVEFLSCGMVDRIKNPIINNGILEGNVLLLSETIPKASFNVGTAMARNKYIYAISNKTIVVHAEYKKDSKGIKSGGTWNGAVENLRGKLMSPNSLIWKNPKYKANLELINDFDGQYILDPDDEESLSKLVENNNFEETIEEIEIDLTKIDLSKLSNIKLEEILLIENNINKIKTSNDIITLNIRDEIKKEIIKNINNKDYFWEETLITLEKRSQAIDKFKKIKYLEFKLNPKSQQLIYDAQVLTIESNSIYPLLLLTLPQKDNNILFKNLFSKEIKTLLDFD